MTAAPRVAIEAGGISNQPLFSCLLLVGSKHARPLCVAHSLAATSAAPIASSSLARYQKCLGTKRLSSKLRQCAASLNAEITRNKRIKRRRMAARRNSCSAGSGGIKHPRRNGSRQSAGISSMLAVRAAIMADIEACPSSRRPVNAALPKRRHGRLGRGRGGVAKCKSPKILRRCPC